MALIVLVRNVIWSLATFLSVLFVCLRQKIRLQSLFKKERDFSLFKVLRFIGYQSDEMWAVAVQLVINPAAKVYSSRICSEPNVQLDCLQSTVRKAFLLYSWNYSAKRKLALKVNKLFIGKIYVSMQHITSLNGEKDIRPGRHSINCNNYFSKREGK